MKNESMKLHQYILSLNPAGNCVNLPGCGFHDFQFFQLPKQEDKSDGLYHINGMKTQKE